MAHAAILDFSDIISGVKNIFYIKALRFPSKFGEVKNS